MDRSKQLAFPIHPTNTSSVCIELAGGIRICCIGRKLKRCRYGLELYVAMPAFVRTLTEPSIFASARIEWLSCGSRITALGSSPRPTASRSRRKRRWINDDATIARPEILLAAVGNPALSHSTTYPRSASLTSRRGSRPIPRFLTRNRKFESISLQRGVRCELDTLGRGRVRGAVGVGGGAVAVSGAPQSPQRWWLPPTERPQSAHLRRPGASG